MSFSLAIHEETVRDVFVSSLVNFLLLFLLIQDLDAEELGGNISWLPPNLTERVRDTQFSGGLQGGVQSLDWLY